MLSDPVCKVFGTTVLRGLSRELMLSNTVCKVFGT